MAIVGWMCAGATVAIALAGIVAVLRSGRPLVDAHELHRDDLIRNAAHTPPIAVDGLHRLWLIVPDRDSWQPVCFCRWVGRERDAVDYPTDRGAAVDEWLAHVAAYPILSETTEMGDLA